MALKMTPGPFQRTKRSTTKIMLELFAVLCVVWIFAAVFHFVNIGSKNGISVLLIGIVSIVVSCLCDVVVGLISKVALKDMFKHVLNSYSYVTGIIFALCLPANTSYVVVIIGSLFGTTAYDNSISAGGWQLPKSLEKVTITKQGTIFSSMFSNCTKIKKVTRISKQS